MNLGAIINLIITIATNVPNAISLFTQGIAAIEAATDPKGKVSAIAAMIDKISKEVQTVLADL